MRNGTVSDPRIPCRSFSCMIDGDIKHSTMQLVLPSIIQQTLPVSAMPFLGVYSDKIKTGGLALSRPLYTSLSLARHGQWLHEAISTDAALHKLNDASPKKLLQ